MVGSPHSGSCILNRPTPLLFVSLVSLCIYILCFGFSEYTLWLTRKEKEGFTSNGFMFILQKVSCMEGDERRRQKKKNYGGDPIKRILYQGSDTHGEDESRKPCHKSRVVLRLTFEGRD